MKKILSLLSMLMIAVTAFATDFIGQLDYKVTTKTGFFNGPSYANGTLKIEDYAGGKYTVTATGCDLSSLEMDNWGEIICEGVEATTDANGVTTIDVTPYALRGSDNAELTNAKLFVKFKGDKAYATFKGTYNPNFFTNITVEYTFGVDEGFEGGGSTGGGDEKPAAFEKVNFVGDGTNFNWSIPVDWDTQKIVMSIDPSTCTGACEDIIGLGEVATAWNNTLHLYRKPNGTLQGYFQIPGGSNNNTNPFDETNPIKVEVSKAKGFVVNDVVKIPASEMSALFALSTVNMGTGEGANDKSRATYNYVKVVDKDWTETTKPEVKEEKSFTDAISMVANGVSEPVGQAQVTIKEMTDKTISMTLAIVGQEGAEYTASGFTKTVDTEKNRTTYNGKINVDGDDFDVTALVYTDGAEKLYMVAKGAEYNYVVGTNPDAPTVVYDKTYTSNLRIYDGEEPVVDEAEAQVNVTMYSDDTYKITLKDVSLLNQTSDLVFVGKAIAEETDSEAPRTIMAKSDGATTNFFGEEMNATFEITEVSADEVKMGFSIESDNFSYLGEFNYAEEVGMEVYTSNLHIYDASAPETDLFQADKATVEFQPTSSGEFYLTLKDVTLNEKTQDLVFTGTLPTTETGGQEPLAEEGEGEVTPDEPAMVLNATADEATATFLGAASATAEFSISYNAADEFMMTFTMKAGEKNYGGEFNYEAKTPAAEPFCKENYVADGNGFEWEIPVDWDTQKIVMSIDPSTCTGSCEHVIGLGAVPTAWNNTLNLYRTSADQMLQGYFQVPGGSNNNTDKFAETVPFLVEVSKAQGFVVNGEVKIAASAMSYLFTLPTVKMGTGEGVNDKSRATYNYVKVVDKDWTKDPEAGINATTVADGEFEVFSVDGVKLSKLQKGLNIVRSADGKVKKVLVK